MIDINTLTRPELSFVAEDAIWSFEVWAETPEGHDFWSDVTDRLRGAHADLDAARREKLRAQFFDYTSEALAKLAADALAKLDDPAFVDALAALRARGVSLPEGTTVGVPRITDVG